MANEPLITLVVRGRNIAPGSLICCFSNASQSSIHLGRAIADFSSSKSLMSKWENLEGKKHFQEILDEVQPPRLHFVVCYVAELYKSLKITLHWYEQLPMFDIPYAAPVPKYRTDEGTCRYWSEHPSTQMFWSPTTSVIANTENCSFNFDKIWFFNCCSCCSSTWFTLVQLELEVNRRYHVRVHLWVTYILLHLWLERVTTIQVYAGAHFLVILEVFHFSLLSPSGARYVLRLVHFLDLHCKKNVLLSLLLVVHARSVSMDVSHGDSS